MHEKSNESAFLTAEEAHALVGKDKISRRSWYNALTRNQIPNIRIGRRILIPRHAFNKWLDGRGTASQLA